jgi:hypothetical protein
MTMGSESRVYSPGDAVPTIGIYECDTACGHDWVTEELGDRFPPLPDGCSGRGWVLATAVHVGQ